MIKTYVNIIKRLANLWEQDYYEPYFDRWEETPFHDPKDHESYDYEPAGILTQPMDMGDQAIEMVKQQMIQPNKKRKKKPKDFENY